MKTLINTTINGFAILTDERETMNPLADYIDQSPLFNVTETRWNRGLKQGTIILYATNKKGIIENKTELQKLIKQHNTQN